MTVRHLTNDPDDLVIEALDGLQRAYPDGLDLSSDPAFLARAKPPVGPKVALVSGGGSGHEPLHTGFVGAGMLDAAVPGAVFASPTAFQIKAAVDRADHGRGVLLIVKNYTGDVLNFSIAAELAAEDGIDVATVLVDDDLATDFNPVDQDASDSGGPGRRGTAAVVAVEKICGAAAERGASLGELVTLGRRVAGSARTMALALEACTHPGQVRPSFDLPGGEVEFGVGIHGERGIDRRPAEPLRDMVVQLTRPIVDELALDRDDQVIAIVNGLGATHGLELAAAHRDLTDYLGDGGVRVSRSLVGSYVTSLSMRGLSITLVAADGELLELWDAPVNTPALTW